jgi:hypothetical protein
MIDEDGAGRGARALLQGVVTRYSSSVAGFQFDLPVRLTMKSMKPRLWQMF